MEIANIFNGLDELARSLSSSQLQTIRDMVLDPENIKSFNDAYYYLKKQNFTRIESDYLDELYQYGQTYITKGDSSEGNHPQLKFSAGMSSTMAVFTAIWLASVALLGASFGSRWSEKHRLASGFCASDNKGLMTIDQCEDRQYWPTFNASVGMDVWAFMIITAVYVVMVYLIRDNPERPAPVQVLSSSSTPPNGSTITTIKNRSHSSNNSKFKFFTR